ncbi:hypothetical protein C2G38_2233870 [Gigaspora rosea]|uniref:DNA-directed DNA polymerase family B exonuclease domain-containing protein n=1 Tax=Gigaspora rosea TaxID=44941 RepID=A0A397U0H1_9GLOM|nr:hypothetical protein C2G38_2233870 [Gigaspora rosea]
MKRKKFSKNSSKKKINSKAQSKFNDSCYADFLLLSKKIDDEFNLFPRDYSFIIFQTNLEIIEINEREYFSHEIIQRLQEIFNLTTTKQIIKQNKQDIPEKLVKLQFLIFSCAGKIVATFEITDPNLFFVYEAVDVSNYDDGYLLRLYSVLENGQKFFIDIIEYDIFFDIKLKDSSLLNSYLEDFVITRATINHQKHRKALQLLKNKIENLNEELQKIRDSKKTKKKIDVAREHDFELVSWHRLKSGVLQDQIAVSFSDIERVESNVLPKLIIQAWDIECGSKRGPGFFPVAEQPDDYIYMIQLDIFLYNQSQPLKRYNITSLPINTSLFFEKYDNEISCSPNDFNFVLVNSEEEILLEFAKINYLYQKDIEIGYNTGVVRDFR